MRYMLLMCRDEERWDAMSVEEKRKIYREAVEYSEARRPSGFYVGGEPLESTSAATTVRITNGRTSITDGPFAETKEQLGGYTLVEANDLDEVLAFVARHPLLQGGHSIEVRPIRQGPPK